MEQTAQNLEALEQRAERALEKMERGHRLYSEGWREFGAAAAEIRSRGLYEQTGLIWANYCEQTWGRSGRYVNYIMRSARLAPEIDAALAEHEHDVPGPLPRTESHYRELARFNDSGEAADFWINDVRPHLDDRGGLDHVELNRLGVARRSGVTAQMEERDVEIPEYPAGPTPEERAYTAASELLSAAMDVTPEAAADSISPGLAETVAKRYEALIPWTRRFVAQLHLRSGGSSAGGAR